MAEGTVFQGTLGEKITLERRRAPRYQFIADADVTKVPPTTNLKAKTGDLSLGGCFLDMPNPLPEGTEIQLRISHANAEFTALARVVFVFPNLGMGVMFTGVESGQQTVLQKWLAELSRRECILQPRL